MKILVVGDPHGSEKIKKIPFAKIKPDVIFCPGDLGKADLARKQAFENIQREKEGLPSLEKEVKQQKAAHFEIHNSTINVMRYLSKFASVYTIQGNVGLAKKSDVNKDYIKFGIKLPCTLDSIKKIKNLHLVKNRLLRVGSLRVGFIDYFVDDSWVKEFGEKNKKYVRSAKKETLKIKKILNRWKKVDILVCHQPPYGVLDKVTAKFAPKHWQGKHAGSKVILNYVKKYSPRYVVCGHIHEGKGKQKIGNTEVINAGCCGDYFVLDID